MEFNSGFKGLKSRNRTDTVYIRWCARSAPRIFYWGGRWAWGNKWFVFDL